METKATIQPVATEEEARSQRTRQSIRNEGSNGSYKRGAYSGNINNKNILQGNIAELLVTTFTNIELEIRVKSFTRTTEGIANYVGREYSKEMGLLVKNQKENEPKEPVMPGKEEARSPFMMKKNENTQ